MTSSVFFSNFALNSARAEQISSSLSRPEVAPIGAWSVVCSAENVTDSTICEMQQVVQNKQRPEISARVVLFRTADHQQNMIRIFVPSGVELIPGIALRLKEQDLGILPYRRCSGKFCLAEATISQKLLTALQKGQLLDLYLYFTPEQPMSLQIKLDGFNEAYKKLPN